MAKALVISLLGVGVMVGLGADPAVVAAPFAGQDRSQVVVRPGDTLWSVARQHEPSEDPLATIEEIRELNDLPDYTVHPGQTLLLP
ncbi:MAG: LysM peptidoglycan-binding domain-containing protein [Micromonosporaceae bacterium]